jgi:hypothetical protein
MVGENTNHEKYMVGENTNQEQNMVGVLTNQGKKRGKLLYPESQFLPNLF